MRKSFTVVVLSILALSLAPANADPLTDKLAQLSTNLYQQFSVPIEHWRFLKPDVPGGERPDLDDHAWQDVSPGFTWPGENTKVWFRATVRHSRNRRGTVH